MNVQGLNFQCNNYLTSFGIGSCFLADKTPKGIIFTDLDFSLPMDTDPGVLVSELESIDNTGRVQYVQDGVISMEASGGDVRVSQEGFGASVPIGLNAYQETYTFVDGGICLYKSVMRLHGKRLRVMLIDEDNNVLLNCYNNNNNGVTQFLLHGFDVNVGVYYRRNNGTNTGAVIVVLYYNRWKSEFDNAIAFNLGVSELKTWVQTYCHVTGLLNGPASFGFRFKLKTVCGDVDETSSMTTSDLPNITAYLITQDGTKLMATSKQYVRTPDTTVDISFAKPSKVSNDRIYVDFTDLNASKSFRDTGLAAPTEIFTMNVQRTV